MALFNSNKFKNTQVTLRNLVTIEGYAAGREKRPFVSVVDRLEIAHAETGFGKKKSKTVAVSALICTATIPATATELRTLLSEKADKLSSIPTNNIIVVSKKFLKLPKKQQLVLLEIEYRKLAGDKDTLTFNTDLQKTNLNRDINADVSAITKYGKSNFVKATAKAKKLVRSGELELGCALRKDEKHAAKMIKKSADVFYTDIFEDIDDSIEEIIPQGC